MKQTDPILIGSTYPPSLIRARVFIEPQPIEKLKAELQTRPVISFWGHDNTLGVAGALLDANLAPTTKRPSISLSPRMRPILNNAEFDECWVLSPDYAPGFRPKIGEEVTAEKIKGWQVLKMTWISENGNQSKKELS